MHICMVASEFLPKIGGVSHYVHSLSMELIQKGHEVTVITRGSWKDTRRESVKGINIYRVQFLPLYPFHIKLHEIFLNKVFRLLESDFDVVHIHHPLSPIVHTSLPVVVTMHTTGIEQGRSIELVNLSSLANKLFFTYIRTIEQKTLHNADLITSVSNKVAEELERYYNVDRSSVITIGNGVDTKFFIPKKTRKGRTYILYSGRLGYRKGLIDLIKSAKYICPEHPEVSFVLTGRGPLERTLKRVVKKMKLTENFLFLGYVDRNRLLDCYQNATVCVIPSHYEGLPTVLLEAMACGIPVVATNVGGMPEVVTNGKNGFIIPTKDPKAIATAVLKLLENQELRTEMGKCARETVEKHYSWDKIAHRILSCYERVVK